MRSLPKLILALAMAFGALFASTAAMADAGFVALEGSDSTAYHQDPQYTPQLFKYLQGASAKPVLVLGGETLLYTGGVSTVYQSSLAGVTLSNYSALYIEAPGGCCTADNTALNGYGAAVKSFVGGGGNLSIENYIGGSYDGVIVGGAGAPAGSILGFGTGGGGATCTDNEVVTAFGAGKGFTQPPVDGCWEHQAYEMSYWGALGYQSLIASDPTGYTFGDGTGVGSAFLALGGTLGTVTTGAVPEVSSWIMMIAGIGLMGGVLRRRNAAAGTMRTPALA